MLRQYDAQNICDVELRKHGLWQLGWRTSFSKSERFMGLCNYQYKRILVSIPHLNGSSEVEFKDTVLHEIAHALCGHNPIGPNGAEDAHGPIWQKKALEIGCSKATKCGHSNVDAGRGLSEVEVIEPGKIKAVQNFCPRCFETAVEVARTNMKGKTWIRLRCGHIITHDQIKNKFDEIKAWQSKSGKTVYPFQAEGIKFVGEANGRALIADEMTLGKTIQALGCMKFYPEICPVLWVTKSSLGLQAIREALDWCGPEYMGQIIQHGKMFIIPNLKLYIISMDLLRRMPTEKIEEIPFKCVIADEIQHFKNPDSTRTNELRKLVQRAEYFIPLSGTPWKNRGSEFFPVLNMLKPEMFPSFKHFKNNWVDEVFDKQRGKYVEGGIRNIPEFRKKTAGFIIRRMRDDVMPDLPKIDRRVRLVMMDELYEKAYDKSEEKVAAQIKDALLEGKSMKDVAQMIMQLKHITGLAKVKTAIEDAQEWLENCPTDYDKLTIFHHHIDVGDNIQNGDGSTFEGLDKWLVEKGYNKTIRLFGGRDPWERDAIVQNFKNDSKNRILLASTLASGEGLNLQFCRYVMQLERQWNPQNEEQAEMRFPRPLNKQDLPEYLWPLLEVNDEKHRKITVPYLIAANTVDEILTTIVDRKRLEFRRSMNEKDINITWDEIAIINEVAQAIINRRYKNQQRKVG